MGEAVVEVKETERGCLVAIVDREVVRSLITRRSLQGVGVALAASCY